MSEETIELLGDAGAVTNAVIRDSINGASEGGDEEPADSVDSAEPELELSPDEVRERRSLVRRIARYKTVFPEEVSELAAELEGLTYKSPEELASLLEEVQFLVETRRSTAQARGLFLAATTMGEAAGPYVGLKLQGLTATAASSDEILRTVDECALKFEGVVQIDPVARLAMAVGQLALAVDGANRARETTTVQPTEQPTEQPTRINKSRDEFSDL